MNAIPVPGRKFTAYFVVASCHSVSNHVMHTTGLFCRHLSFLQRRFIGCRRSRFRLPLLRELGLELRVSRYSCTLTRCTPPNRVHFQAPQEPLYYGLAVRFQLLPTDGFRRRSYFQLQVC